MRNGYVVTYTFVLESATKRTIIATRIGSRPWRLAAVPIPDERTGIVFDDERRLTWYSSHVIHLHTSIIPGRRLFGPTPLACKVVAVVYDDKSSWAAKPSSVLPSLSQHGAL